MPSFHSKYVCQQCGYESTGWLGKCPECGTWNSLVETVVSTEGQKSPLRSKSFAGQAKPKNLSEIKTSQTKRISTKIPELDRVLGGGLVSGQVVLVAGEPGIGKCVIGDTLVPTDQGLISIEKLKPKNAKKGFARLHVGVQSLNGPENTSHFYTSDKEPTKKVTTRMGYELQATYTHPILILSHEGKRTWKEMERIKVGDYIAVQRHGAVWGNNTALPPFKFKINTNAVIPNFPGEIDERMAYCLGLLVGDGGLTDFGRVNLTTVDSEIKKIFERWISSLGLKIYKIRDRYSVNNRIFHLWLEHVGLRPVRSELKCVPEIILSAPKEIVKSFLRGLFDTDGSSNCKSDGSMPGAVEYCTASKRLAKQVHLLLLQFGIVGKLRFRKNQKHGAWIIQLLGDNARLFYSEIGFRLIRKQNSVRLLPKISNNNLDVIPYLPQIDPFRIPRNHRWDRRYLRGIRAASYEKLEKISKFIPELKLLLTPRFYWDRVENITEKEKSVCYDLSIPKTRSFVTDGIVSHNSTILLQLASKLTSNSQSLASVLYVCGEESAGQIAIRAKRLEVSNKNIRLLETTDVDAVIEQLLAIDHQPLAIIVDSIQTMTTNDLSGMAGSIGQVRECATRLTRLAKSLNIPLFLVGHVTKEGAVAGPAVLAHIVDTILWFEGDKTLTLRLLRAVKNRFGPTDEVGIFEMEDKGLISVSDAEKLFMTKNPPAGGVPGSVVTSILSGTRPLLVEIQALVVASKMAFPKRVAQGIDSRRLELLLAVLIRRCGLPLYDYDVFVNVAGGIKVEEPGADLAICLAIASAYFDKPILVKTVAVGEVGLLGEIREVIAQEKRIKEARRMGFTQVISSKEFRFLGEVVKVLTR